MKVTVGNTAGTALGALVTQGVEDPTLEPVTDRVWMSRDVSNSYAVMTDDGCVVINAGTASGGIRHRRLYDEAGLGPIRHIVLTQSHTDHIGGLGAFGDTGATVIAQANIHDVRGYWMRLGEFYTSRSNRLWERVIGPRDVSHQRDVRVSPDITFDDQYEFTLGGTRFELLSLDGGETTDSLAVHLPDAGVVFCGNVLGPMYLQVPNLYTVRGDKIRSALAFIRSVDRLIALAPSILVTGHGEPIRGAEKIRTDLTRIRDGVQYIHDQTVAGMNQGRDLYTLMREITLPEHLSLGEGHGKVSWNVRAIWNEYAGWFHYASTTELYAVPASDVAGDLLELAGVGPVIERAQRYLDAGQAVHALHLLDLIEQADASTPESARVHEAALTRLLADSGRANLSETMWLQSEIERVHQLTEGLDLA